MPLDNTATLKKMMKKHKWSIDDLRKMLPINGKPRSHSTVYSWVTDSQPKTIPDDCLTILKLTVKLNEK